MIYLDEEWEHFNKSLHAEKQTLELQTPQHKTTQEITVEKTINTKEVEHIPVTLTSRVILRIEEIHPLNVFYSPIHKAVVKR